MAIYPGAVQRLIPHANTENVRATVRHRINFHTAVTDASSLYPYFSQPGQPCSHFYVAEDGTVEQYIDTDFFSAADYQGNDATISIESWDGYGRLWTAGGQPPAWTAAQVAALKALSTWITHTHRTIPIRLASDSRVGESSRGLSWHRLGVESSPPFRPGYRVDGGMYYSTAIGKTCPGDARIAQIPGILAAIPPAPPLPNVLEDKMIVILNKSNNAAIIVSGGRSAPVVGWDQYVTLTQTLPNVGVSAAQFNAIVASFPLTA
ncbi:N-acetylmuramoyl-L-alanine amidase [Oerskovia sp. NPDC057915]|uniref:peptidoglycan recognition protein family protein n=1 Tax=Oerskovia sp. NPDC057915 TaxID=3346280 RepID=UPI0036DA5FEA